MPTDAAGTDISTLVLGICVGVSLAATCGFRVFVPLFVMSIAAHSGHLKLSEEFMWAGSWPAMITLGTATLLEIGAYYIPWLDNLLDTAATPMAVIAGTIVTASCVSEVSPMLKWSLALVAGGGAAGVVQVATTTVRAVSTATTGGLGNPVVSTAEAGASVVISIMAILIPVVVGVLVVVGIIFALRYMYQKLTGGKPEEVPAT